MPKSRVENPPRWAACTCQSTFLFLSRAPLFFLSRAPSSSFSKAPPSFPLFLHRPPFSSLSKAPPLFPSFLSRAPSSSLSKAPLSFVSKEIDASLVFFSFTILVDAIIPVDRRVAWTPPTVEARLRRRRRHHFRGLLFIKHTNRFSLQTTL